VSATLFVAKLGRWSPLPRRQHHPPDLGLPAPNGEERLRQDGDAGGRDTPGAPESVSACVR